MTADRRCVVCTKPRTADVGHLCEGHAQRLADTLHNIEAEAIHLETVPSFQQRTGSRPAGLASHRSPAVLNAIVATDPRRGRPPRDAKRYDPLAFDDTASALETLHGWARVIREERHLTPPDTVTITGERDLLTRQLTWAAGQPWIDEAYEDLTRLLSQLRATNHTGADKAISPCPVIVDTQTCPGRVWMHDEVQLVWRRYPDRCARDWEEAPGPAVCDTCGSSWKTDADKARLKRMIEDTATELTRPRTVGGRPMLTADELVAGGYVSSVGNVRVRAHREGIVSVDGHYDPAAFAERMTG